MTAGITMDAGGLIALDRDERRVVVLLARARETGARVTVPVPVLAEAIRKPERQARLSRLIRQPTTDVIALDRVDATSVGRVLAASGTSDLADAHVVICARRAGQPVVTSDPSDLHELDPTLRLIALQDSTAGRGKRAPGCGPKAGL
jgi:predicted nucleic acid-binding protein